MSSGQVAQVVYIPCIWCQGADFDFYCDICRNEGRLDGYLELSILLEEALPDSHFEYKPKINDLGWLELYLPKKLLGKPLLLNLIEVIYSLQLYDKDQDGTQ